MPLNLSEVPPEAMVEALSTRYPNMVLIGANDTFVNENRETVTDMLFINGNILIDLGLLEIARAHMMHEWNAGCTPADDAP
jgi:hypothetical protein